MGLNYTSEQKYASWLREVAPQYGGGCNFTYKKIPGRSFFEDDISEWGAREAVPVSLDARQIKDIDEYLEIIRTRDIPHSYYDMLARISGPSGSPRWFTNALRPYFAQEWIDEWHRKAHTHCRGHVDMKLDCMLNIISETQVGKVKTWHEGEKIIWKIQKRWSRRWRGKKCAIHNEGESAQYRHLGEIHEKVII